MSAMLRLLVMRVFKVLADLTEWPLLAVRVRSLRMQRDNLQAQNDAAMQALTILMNEIRREQEL